MINLFDNIPNEMLVKIFANLDQTSVNKVFNVCHRFRNVISKFEDKMQKITLNAMFIKVLKNRHQKDIGYTIDFAHGPRSTRHFPSKLFIVSSEYDNTPSGLPIRFGNNIYVKNPIDQLMCLLDRFVRCTIVKELHFEEITLTEEFLDGMTGKLSSCCVDWLILRCMKLDVSSTDFGRFVVKFHSSGLQFVNVLVNKDVVVSGDNEEYLKLSLRMNPQLTGLSSLYNDLAESDGYIGLLPNSTHICHGISLACLWMD